MRFDPARIFQTLDDYGVDYLAIGGWAVVAHGYVRATVDIDFVADQDADNIERLARALASMGARLRGVDADKLDNDPTDPEVLGNGASLTMETDFGPIDFLNDVPGARPYVQMRDRSIETSAAGVRIRVVGLDDLIAMKEASGRDRDHLDIRELKRPSDS
jgi:predicted nucleotidyltransferase